MTRLNNFLTLSINGWGVTTMWFCKINKMSMGIYLDTRDEWQHRLTLKLKGGFDKMFAPVAKLESMKLFTIYDMSNVIQTMSVGC